jgi:hypothetical protein
VLTAEDRNRLDHALGRIEAFLEKTKTIEAAEDEDEDDPDA